MDKKLSEMSLEELWQLFPIILTKHQECWKEWYLEEEKLLKNILPQVEKNKPYRKYGNPCYMGKTDY